MHKSLYSSPAEDELFLRLLREVRASAGVSQIQLAKKLGVTQGIISKCETGGRRLHVIELRTYLLELGVDLHSFMRELDKRLDARITVVKSTRLRK